MRGAGYAIHVGNAKDHLNVVPLLLLQSIVGCVRFFAASLPPNNNNENLPAVPWLVR